MSKYICVLDPALCDLRLCRNTDGTIYVEVNDRGESCAIALSAEDAIALGVEIIELARGLYASTTH